jgi:flavorubredoxin
MNISDKIKYIGVDDTTLDLFESQYAVPDGVSYNSYVILDDKTAIMDTVDKRGMKDWENNLLNALDGRNADYVYSIWNLTMLEALPDLLNFSLKSL